MATHTTGRSDRPFPGFGSPNYTQVPDELFDQLMPELGDGELRVLLYIVRRTFGFKRDADAISLSQMVNGITTRDGRVLDRGAGLSKASAARAVKGLVEKGIVRKQKSRSSERGDEANTYALRFREVPVSQIETPPRVSEQDTPVSQTETDKKQVRQETGTASNFESAHAQDFSEPSKTSRFDFSQTTGGLETEPPEEAARPPVDRSDASEPPPQAEGQLKPETAVLSDPPAFQTASAPHEEAPPAQPDAGELSAPRAGYALFRQTALKHREALRGQGMHPRRGDQDEQRPRFVGERDAARTRLPRDTARGDVQRPDGSATLGQIIAARTAHLAARPEPTASAPPPNLASSPRTDQPPNPASPARTVADQQPASPSRTFRRRGRPPGSRDERDVIGGYIKDFARELNDQAPLASSITRALNAFQRAGIPPERFPDFLYEARSITQEHSAQIKTKPKGDSFQPKPKMGYYFAVLEDLLGLRDRGDNPTTHHRNQNHNEDKSPPSPDRATATTQSQRYGYAP